MPYGEVIKRGNYHIFLRLNEVGASKPHVMGFSPLDDNAKRIGGSKSVVPRWLSGLF